VATLVLPSEFALVLGSLLLAAMGGLAPVLPLMAGPVVPPPSAAASAGAGLVTAAAAAAAAREEVVAAACDGAAGVFCGGWAARVGWRLGAMMTETCFNDLTARVGAATTALESVTATVIELHVCRKPGFRIQLEALLASGLGSGVGFKDLTAWRQMAQEQSLGFNVLVLDSAVIDLCAHWKPGFRIKLEASLSTSGINDLDDLMTRTEKKTFGACEALVERECCLGCLNTPTLRP